MRRPADLSPHGLRALSRRHRHEPFSIELAGQTYTVDYGPAESTNHLFGGNSNWRGPGWTGLVADLILQLGEQT